MTTHETTKLLSVINKLIQSAKQVEDDYITEIQITGPEIHALATVAGRLSAEIEAERNEMMELLPHDVIRAVCTVTGISFEDIFKETRRKEIVYPRQLAMCLIYYCSRKTNAEVGIIFGKDHATVIHARKVVSSFISLYKDKLKQFRMILTELYYITEHLEIIESKVIEGVDERI